MFIYSVLTDKISCSPIEMNKRCHKIFCECLGHFAWRKVLGDFQQHCSQYLSSGMYHRFPPLVNIINKIFWMSQDTKMNCVPWALSCFEKMIIKSNLKQTCLHTCTHEWSSYSDCPNWESYCRNFHNSQCQQ